MKKFNEFIKESEINEMNVIDVLDPGENSNGYEITIWETKDGGIILTGPKQGGKEAESLYIDKAIFKKLAKILNKS